MCKIIRQIHVASADGRAVPCAGVCSTILAGCNARSLDAEIVGKVLQRAQNRRQANTWLPWPLVQRLLLLHIGLKDLRGV